MNFKKLSFWVTLAAIVAIVAVGVGVLKNSKESEVQGGKTKVSDTKIIEDRAWEVIENHISIYKSSYSYQPGFKIIDSQITKLENIEIFENILAAPIEIWELKYRLKAKTKNVDLSDEMKKIDGWLVDESSLGKPHLAFAVEEGNRKYLGCFYPRKLEFETLAHLEMGLRTMLENVALLPKESYVGNHVVITFSLPTGETSQLLLSQPVVQGDQGIWVVERWMQEDGTINYAFPDTDIKIEDYYKNLQGQFNDGGNLLLGDPVEVGYNFIINKLDQTFVKKTDLILKNPATAVDFMETPTNHYMGYISGLSTDISAARRFIYINIVEFLGLEDIESLKELKQNPEEELMVLSDSPEYKVLDGKDGENHKMLTEEEFRDYLYNNDYKQMFNVYTKDGFVIRIEEQYMVK